MSESHRFCPLSSTKRSLLLILNLCSSKVGDLSREHLIEIRKETLLPEFSSSNVKTICREIVNIPGISLFYTHNKRLALRNLIQREDDDDRFVHVCIILPEDDDTAAEGLKFVGKFLSTFPSVLGENHKTILPTVSVAFPNKTDPSPIPYIDIVGGLGDEKSLLSFKDKIESTIKKQLSSDTTQNIRANLQNLENSQKQRSALLEPLWISELVENTYSHCPTDRDEFPSLDADHLEGLKRKIDDWEFYAPSLNRDELLNVILLIFEKFRLIEELNIPLNTFKSFILVIEYNYHPNPYHNFHHAVDVLQCCYYVMKTSLMLRQMLSPIDVMALFVAAISHDVGHPSFNNSFLIEHESLVAWLWNDRSVLENMHSTILFAIIRHPKYNFTINWKRCQWKEFRSIVVGSILGTDMAQHFDFIRQFNGIDGLFSKVSSLINNHEESLSLERRKLLSISVIKFADICNVVRPFHISRKWGFHLVCEFFHQGDWERVLGYQGSPMTHRSLTDLSKGQQYFLNNVAGPLYRCMAEYFTELHFAEEQLKSNLEQWRLWKPETDDIIRTISELTMVPCSNRKRKHSNSSIEGGCCSPSKSL